LIVETYPAEIVDEIEFETKSHVNHFDHILKEHETYHERKGNSWSFEDLDEVEKHKMAKGAAFEVVASNEFLPPSENTQQHEIEQTLLEIIRFPPPEVEESLKSSGVGSLRNPDAIKIETNDQTGEYVVKRIVEATTGRLDERKYNQITNFENDIDTLLKVLEGFDSKHYEGWDMPDLSKNRIFLDFELELVIIMPSDANPEEPNTVVDTGSNQKDEELMDFIRDGDITILRSSYSSKDLDNIASQFIRLSQKM